MKAWLRHGRDATPNRGQPRLARHAGHLSWTMRCTSSSRPVTVSFARRCNPKRAEFGCLVWLTSQPISEALCSAYSVNNLFGNYT